MFLRCFLANIAVLVFFQQAFSQKKDSVRMMQISDKVYADSKGTWDVQPMDFMFFDTDVRTIYYKIWLSGTEGLKENAFVFLEIKKKTKDQFRLRPLYSRKIDLSSFKTLEYMDSVVLDDARLASGNFEFIANLMNDSLKVLHAARAAFQLLRDSSFKIRDEYYEAQQNRETNVVDLERSFVGKYDLPTLKRNINALLPLAEGVEERVIHDLGKSEDMKFLRQFFYNFWYNRNTKDPEAEWKLYTEKLNTVAQRYGSANNPGYETDRGRIFIQYGEPDKLEKLPAEKDALPYEIWFYHHAKNKSNVAFIFYQPGISGSQMRLLHSTEENEIVNPYWRQQLFLDPDNSDNKLIHRAYEYFKY